MKKVTASFLIALLYVFAATSQDSPRVYTLSECIESAMSNGTDNRILQGNLAVAREQYAQTVAQNSFSLTGTVGAGINRKLSDSLPPAVGRSFASNLEDTVTAQAGLKLTLPLTSISVTSSPYLAPTGTDDIGGSLALSVSQTLWNGYPGGTGRAAVRKSLLALQGKELTAETSRLNLVFQVRQQYIAVLGAQQALAVLDEIVGQQEALLKQINAVYDLKQASLSDLRSAQANALTAEVDRTEGRHTLDIAKLRLANLMGVKDGGEFTVAGMDAPEMPPLTLEEAIEQGLKQRTDERQVELARKTGKIDLDLIRGQRTPSVGLTGGLTGGIDYSGGSAWSVQAGVSIGLPLLDSGAARHAAAANLEQDRVYSLQQTQLRDTITADIRSAYETLGIQLQRIEAARLTEEARTMDFQVVQVRNSYGTATNQDLLTASVAAANARTALAQARNNAQLALIRLQNVMGM